MFDAERTSDSRDCDVIRNTTLPDVTIFRELLHEHAHDFFGIWDAHQIARTTQVAETTDTQYGYTETSPAVTFNVSAFQAVALARILFSAASQRRENSLRAETRVDRVEHEVHCDAVWFEQMAVYLVRQVDPVNSNGAVTFWIPDVGLLPTLLSEIETVTDGLRSGSRETGSVGQLLEVLLTPVQEALEYRYGDLEDGLLESGDSAEDALEEAVPEAPLVDEYDTTN